EEHPRLQDGLSERKAVVVLRTFLRPDHQGQHQGAGETAERALDQLVGEQAPVHAARPRRSPSRPVGRKTSTTTRTTNATTSVHAMPIAGIGGTSASTRPSKSPPIMAPRMLPMPPSTAAANAL